MVWCPRTRPAVKVLLCAPFCTILLLCLLRMFISIHTMWWCNDKILYLLSINILAIGFLTPMEFLYILVVAFLRTVAVWSPQRHQVKLRTSVTLVVNVPVWNTVCSMVIASSGNILHIQSKVKILHTLFLFLPVVLTLACYFSMIVVIRRNKRRVAATQDTAVTGKVMDQATRAMLALFITNLILILPFSIRFLLPHPYITNSVYNSIFGFLYTTHFFADPVVFVCFNNHHRKRVLQALKSFQQWVCCRPASTPQHTLPTFPLRFLQNVEEGY
ncbi:hypothetical protein E2C01_056215 [Portunus trituberculatus]|uniref:G-protein coupled receptors family 1 profile domain-containing protein n=2 Tax=Portunus trituberculatus TaxID=210409 RepID=A0A5B7GTH7_PORTR|nr:hypothetical protein [Portunus trituberculatus]